MERGQSASTAWDWNYCIKGENPEISSLNPACFHGPQKTPYHENTRGPYHKIACLPTDTTIREARASTDMEPELYSEFQRCFWKKAERV